MEWQKYGHVYVADGRQPWAQTHAFIPTCHLLDEDRIRVYAAFLDADQTGRVGFVDVDAADPRRVLEVSPAPVLDIGAPGTFDDSGVTPVCITALGDRLRLYYVGWQRGVHIRYTLFVGAAESLDGGNSFTRVSEVPVLERSDTERYVRTACHVRQENGRWRMWYIAGNDWVEVDGKQVPTYDMRYLESGDGLSWGKQGRVCMPLEGTDEYGFGRPCIVATPGAYRMWYSVRTRSRGYHLGYAESVDGLQWTRKDGEVGITTSDSGWDAEMTCFGCVQPTRHGTWMFYNGNNYGETGFGVARLVADG